MDLQYLLQFETLIENLDYDSIVNICTLNSDYKHLCNQREVWNTLLLKKYGKKYLDDPREEYLLHVRYPTNEVLPYTVDEVYTFPDEYLFAYFNGNISNLMKFKYEDLMKLAKMSNQIRSEGGKVTFMMDEYYNISYTSNTPISAEIIRNLLEPWKSHLERFNRDTGLNIIASPFVVNNIVYIDHSYSRILYQMMISPRNQKLYDAMRQFIFDQNLTQIKPHLKIQNFHNPNNPMYAELYRGIFGEMI